MTNRVAPTVDLKHLKPGKPDTTKLNPKELPSATVTRKREQGEPEPTTTLTDDHVAKACAAEAAKLPKDAATPGNAALAHLKPTRKVDGHRVSGPAVPEKIIGAGTNMLERRVIGLERRIVDLERRLAVAGAPKRGGGGPYMQGTEAPPEEPTPEPDGE